MLLGEFWISLIISSCIKESRGGLGEGSGGEGEGGTAGGGGGEGSVGLVAVCLGKLLSLLNSFSYASFNRLPSSSLFLAA